MNLTPDYVLHKMTYQNVMLYAHATPTYDPEEEKDKNVPDANDPSLFVDAPDEEIVTCIH